MEQRTEEFNQVRGRMAGDIKAVINDGEDLLRAAVNVSSAGLVAARDRIDGKLSGAKARLVDASRPAVDVARKSAAAADGYVHGHPWAVIGAAAVVGALIGFLAARR